MIRYESPLMREGRTEPGLVFSSVFPLHVFILSDFLPPKKAKGVSHHLLILLNLFSFVFPVVLLVFLTGYSAYLQSSIVLISCAYFVLWQFVVSWRPTACTHIFICPFDGHVAQIFT